MLSPSSRQMALLSFRWSKRYGHPSPATTLTLHSRIEDYIVVEDLDVEVLAGTPFMEANDVAVRPAKREVPLGNGSTYTYGSQAPPSSPTTVRRAFVLRAPTPSKTVWSGEFLEVQLPDDAPPDSEYALEPCTDAPSLRNLKPSQLWP